MKQLMRRRQASWGSAASVWRVAACAAMAACVAPEGDGGTPTQSAGDPPSAGASTSSDNSSSGNGGALTSAAGSSDVGAGGTSAGGVGGSGQGGADMSMGGSTKGGADTGAGATGGADGVGGTDASAGSGTGGSSTGGSSTGGSGSTGGSSTGGSGSTACGPEECCAPAPSCPLQQPGLDQGQTALCAAHTFSLAADAGCSFNDSSLTAARCATVDAELCSGQEHWYRFDVRAKRVFAVVPSGNHLSVEVYTSDVAEPSALEDLTLLENGWQGGPFNYDHMRIIDGVADAPTDVWVRVTSQQSSVYSLVVKESDTVLDCVDPRLVGRGSEYGYSLPDSNLQQGAFLGGLFNLDQNNTAASLRFDPSGGGIRSNATACIKQLADPNDASQGWSVMQAVACLDGELQVLHDCIADYPDWDATARATYGELLCDLNVHPAGQLWCEPESQRDDYSAVCALHGLEPGRATCLPDALSGESRYLFGCQSNNGFLFDNDSSLYDPRSTTETGYPTGVDCQALGGESGAALSSEELARGRCGVDALMGETRCLFDREQAALDEKDAEPSFDQFSLATSDFPATQNLVSCANPGPGNSISYTTIDPFSGIYTDAHVAEVAPQIAAMKARGVRSYGYLNVPSPETKTTWKDARFLGNSAPWATLGYQYLYWMDRLGETIGDPGGDYAAVPRRCIDADGDGFDNVSDNCPTIYNRGVDGLQPDADQDGIGDACDPEPDVQAASDVDSDGISQYGLEDNCPTVSNPADGDGNQADADNDGIGDACQTGEIWTCDENCQALTDSCGPAERSAEICQSSPIGTCDAGAGVACLDESGTPRTARTLSWVFDLYNQKTQDLLIAWTKLGALAGLDGMTYDVAVPSECYGSALNTLFEQFVANGGHLERDISVSSDPNDQARQAAMAALYSEVGDLSGFDVGAYKASLSESAWFSSAAYRALSLFNVDFVRRFMREVRDEMDAFMATHRPGESFGTFFNQGHTTLFNSEADAGDPSGYANLKSVSGAETFVRGGHPTHGLYDCVGVEGAAYPSQRTLEWMHALHDNDGMRFWSWNFPGEIPDDRWLLFAAEVLSQGGIAQTPFCSVESTYPYSGYTTPNHTLRLAQAPIAPWMSAQWSRLNLPAEQAQVAFYVPQTMHEPCYTSPEFGFDATERLYNFLREVNYTVDVIGGSGFGLGRTRLPELSTLQEYDFVVLSTEFLSDAEIDVFESFLSAGGTILSTGLPGRRDEWCTDKLGERSSWLSHFSAHGDNTVGSGHVYWLDGVTAYTRPDTLDPVQSRDALDFLHRPNAGTNVCTPGGATCGETGDSFDTNQLVVQDLLGERTVFRNWLKTTLWTDFGLPEPAFGTDLPDDVHVTTRRDAAGLPVYHLVNYALETVPVDPWFDGTLAGVYQSRVAHFGCTLPRSVPSLPVPDALSATGGTVHFAALDYAPPQESFFPNACGPSTPCSSAPLRSEYPTAANGYSYPTGSVAIAPGQNTVTLTWPDDAPVEMKQWLIAWFEVNP